jgi:hypothetical protein
MTVFAAWLGKRSKWINISTHEDGALSWLFDYLPRFFSVSRFLHQFLPLMNSIVFRMISRVRSSSLRMSKE